MTDDDIDTSGSSAPAPAAPSPLPSGVLRWSPQQETALRDLKKWWNNGKPETPIFLIQGFAGTGKSTLALTAIIDLVGSLSNCATMTYSGKAASVLRRKGISNANTIHSWVYSLVQPDEEKYRKLKLDRTAALEAGNKAEAKLLLNEMKMLARPQFVINEDSELRGKKVAALDEVSMANDEIKRDLLRFGIPIIAMGDPGQLPPIEGTGAFFNQRPNAMLTEIHRQALDNPIIRMANDARNNRSLSSYRDPRALYIRGGDASVLAEQCRLASQVIVGKNDTRRRLNTAMRQAAGLAPLEVLYPTEGERVICLKNNRDLGILNGVQFNVLSSEDAPMGIKMQLAPCDPEPGREDDPPILVEAHRAYFDEYLHGGTLKQMTNRDFVGSQEFDFGYAITCHKAQGSQWPRVLIYDDKFGVWDMPLRAKWMYTALTRAEHNVVIIDPPSQRSASSYR